MCGASRSSACELDANDPKVNSVADRKLGGRRFGVSVCLRKNGRFVNPLRNLPARGGNPHTNKVLRCDTIRSALTVAPKQHPTAPHVALGVPSGCAYGCGSPLFARRARCPQFKGSRLSLKAPLRLNECADLVLLWRESPTWGIIV